MGTIWSTEEEKQITQESDRFYIKVSRSFSFKGFLLKKTNKLIKGFVHG